MALALCVAGVLKLTLRTPIVTTTEKVTRIMVKSKYLPENIILCFTKSSTFHMCVRFPHLPNRGTAIEVEGMISASSKKNTVNERRIEIDNDTCSMEGLVR